MKEFKLIWAKYELGGRMYIWDASHIKSNIEIGDIAVVETGNLAVSKTVIPKMVEIINVREYTEAEFREKFAKQTPTELSLEELHRCYKKVISIIPKSDGYSLRLGEEIEIDFKSPTRKTNYTLMEIINKGWERSNLLSDKIEIKMFRDGEYGDCDLAIFIENFRCSEPNWNDSVTFNIQKLILGVHIKKGKRALQLDGPQIATGEYDEELKLFYDEKERKSFYKNGIHFYYMRVETEEQKEKEYIEYDKFDSKHLNELKKLIMKHLESEMWLQKLFALNGKF